MKLKVTTEWGPDVHGDAAHKALFSLSVVGDAIATFRPMPGIEKVCPTLQPDHELSTETRCPFTFSTLPTVPVTLPQYGLRSGVQPSYPRIVTFTLLPAGTLNRVV